MDSGGGAGTVLMMARDTVWMYSIVEFEPISGGPSQRWTVYIHSDSALEFQILIFRFALFCRIQ
jgi:hypothetical protein